MRDITDERLEYMREVSINFDSKTIEFIGDYKNLLSYVIVSELNFQNRMKSFNSEFLEKDFPNLEVAKITSYNVLYRDRTNHLRSLKHRIHQADILITQNFAISV